MLFLKKKYKDINEVKEEFLRIEEKHKIFSETFYEYHYWDFIRTFVFYQIVNELDFYEKASFTKSIDNLNEEKVSLPNLDELVEAKSLVIWNNISKRHIISKDNFNDDTYYVILNKGETIGKELYDINDKMYFWNFDLKEEEKIISNLNEMKKSNELEKLEKILTEIRKRFGISKEKFNPIYDGSFRSIFYNINYSHKIKLNYSRFSNLERVYITIPMFKYFAAAFKDTDVEVIEIQHGVMPSYDIKYVYPPHANKDNTINPDVLYVNNKYWKSYANNSYIYDVKIVESPFLARAKEYENKFISNNVLFISQWNLSHKIANLAVEFATKNPSYNVIIRMHPAEEKDHILKLIKDNKLKNITISETEDIYDDLAVCENVVGVISTVLYQAIEKGNKTFIYDLYNNKGFNSFYENKLAYKVLNAEDLSSKIKNAEFSNNEIIEQFFKQDIEKIKL